MARPLPLPTEEARRIAFLHHPSGGYCPACDHVEEYPEGIEVSNPTCTHRYRSCNTCWDNEDQRSAYPCPTIVAASVLDQSGIIKDLLERWNAMTLIN